MNSIVLWSQIIKVVREPWRSFVVIPFIIEDFCFYHLLNQTPSWVHSSSLKFACTSGKSTALQKITSWAPPHLPSKMTDNLAPSRPFCLPVTYLYTVYSSRAGFPNVGAIDFGLGNSLFLGLSCACLDPPDARVSTHTAVTTQTQNVSTYCQLSPGRAKLLLIENNCSEEMLTWATKGKNGEQTLILQPH